MTEEPRIQVSDGGNSVSVSCDTTQQHPSTSAASMSAPHISQSHIDADATAAGSGSGACLGCHKEAIQYRTSTCRHPVFCRKCAMKCASGGKCKICGQLYPDLCRV